jgi:hypothetical protein
MDMRLLTLSILCIIAVVVAGCTTGTPPADSAPPVPAGTLTTTPVAPIPMTAAGCTMSCQGPLDCGAGSCGCVKGTCSVVPAQQAVTTEATQKSAQSVRIWATPQRYSSMMSSTPGIELSVIMPPTDTSTVLYDWKADYGQFLSWNPPDYAVNQKGSEVTTNGEKIYWSYTEKPAGTASPVTITMTARDTATRKVIGQSVLTLAWDGTNGVMVQGIT